MDRLIKKLFNEALQNVQLHNDVTGSFVIYRGFKIRESQGTYSLRDVRYQDFYSDVEQEDLDIFKRFGFIKGADLISLSRNLSRVSRYKLTIERLYDEKLTIKDAQELDLCNRRINRNIDFMFYYKSKINQFEAKYAICDSEFKDEIEIVKASHKIKNDEVI